MKVVTAIIGALILLVVVCKGYSYMTAPINAELDARQQIYTGSNKIETYNRFYAICSGIQSGQINLKVQRAVLADQPSGDDQFRQRMMLNVMAQEAQLQRDISTYNAAVNQTYTAANFKSSNLPDHIVIDQVAQCN